MAWTNSEILDQSGLFADVREGMRDGSGTLRDRLARALVTAISSGRLPVGARLPAERQIADEVGISRGTVVAALDSLVDSGTIERRQGAGSYVRSAPITATVAGDPDDSRLVTTWLRQATPMDLAISSTTEAPTGLLGAMSATALLTASPQHGYSAVGELAMREAAAHHLSGLGVPSAAADVVITTGAQQALGLVIDALVRPGDRVFVEAPTYPGFLVLIRRAGGIAVPVTSDSEGVLPSALRRAVAEHGPALLCTVPIASNPTGAVTSPTRREELLDVVRQHDLVVLEDLTMADLVYEDLPIGAPLNACPEVRGVVTGSASKTFWGGLRVGWLRAEEPWLSRLISAKSMQDYGTSPVTQHLATQLLQAMAADPGWLPSRLDELRTRRDLLISLLEEHLPAWGPGRPSGGLSLWVRLPGTDSRTYADVADRHGVFVLPGEQCGVDGQFADHIRLCFDREPAVLREAVERLARAYTDMGGPRGARRAVHCP